MYDDLTTNDATCPECGGENLTDRPICPACWRKMGQGMEAVEAMRHLTDFIHYVGQCAPPELEYNGLKGRVNAFLSHTYGPEVTL